MAKATITKSARVVVLAQSAPVTVRILTTVSKAQARRLRAWLMDWAECLFCEAELTHYKRGGENELVPVRDGEHAAECVLAQLALGKAQ